MPVLLYQLKLDRDSCFWEKRWKRKTVRICALILRNLLKPPGYAPVLSSAVMICKKFEYNVFPLDFLKTFWESLAAFFFFDRIQISVNKSLDQANVIGV